MTTKSAKDLVAEASRDIETLSGPEAAKLVGDPSVMFVDVREAEELISRGKVEVLEGRDVLDLSALQHTLTGGAMVCRGISVALLSASVVGLPYVLSKLTLVRRGEVALVEYVDGSMRALGAGWHVLETVGARVTKFALTSDVIQHGALKIIRVVPGNVGLATSNGKALLLGPGRHLINDPLFTFGRQEAVTQAHITIGTIHLITVQQGKVALATVDATAHLLEPGRHYINNPRFTFQGFCDATDEHIHVGSKHRITVPAGKLGLGWNGGEPVLMEPGSTYNIDSATFRYVGSKSAVEPIIVHGRLKVVTVRQGFVGISYNDGVLEVLEPGRHTLTKATHYLSGFLSTGQVVLTLSEIASMTSDNVGIAFDAAVSLRVVDPFKAVTMLCNSEDLGFSVTKMHAVIAQKARLSLSIIIGNNRLNNSFRSTARVAKMSPALAPPDAAREAPHVLVGRGGGGAGGGGAAAAASSGGGGGGSEDPAEEGTSSFKQVIHDVFMHAFSDSMERECGVAIIDMSVEDIKVINPDLARAMAQGAVARTALLKTQIDTEVTRTAALAEQAAEVVRAEGRARAMEITAGAEARKTAVAAQAEAAKVEVMAAAEARRVALLAAAEADRIKTLDAALASASSAMQSREMVRASGDVLREAKSSIVLAHSTADISTLFGAGGAGGAGARGLLSS